MRRRRRTAPMAVVLVCVGLIAAGCASPPLTVVPDLHGKRGADVLHALYQKDLILGDETYSPGSAALRGTVVSQSPSAWSFARPGTRINVILAGPPPESGRKLGIGRDPYGR